MEWARGGSEKKERMKKMCKNARGGDLLGEKENERDREEERRDRKYHLVGFGKRVQKKGGGRKARQKSGVSVK